MEKPAQEHSARSPIQRGLAGFLALRYLKPQRSFASVITLVSMIGVAVGVLMMIVVRSVMGGFELDFRQQLVEGRPHVLLRPAKSDAPWQAMLQRLEQLEGVVAAVPLAEGLVYASEGSGETALQLYGLPLEMEGALVSRLRAKVAEGRWPSSEGEIAVGSAAMAALGLVIGSELRVYSDRAVNDALRAYHEAQGSESAQERSKRLAAIGLQSHVVKVSAVLDSHLLGEVAVTPLATGQQLFALGGRVSALAIELRQPMEVEVWLERHAGSFAGWAAQAWTEGEQGRLAAMRNEQTMMQFILTIIAMVAAFSVMNVTITITTQKRREIGVLSALGAAPGSVVEVFARQASLVGFIGSGLGLGAGLAVLHWREAIRRTIGSLTGAEVQQLEGVFFAEIPAHIDGGQVMLTFFLSWGLCIVAGLIPAWFAARIEPAAALRDL